MSVPLSFARLGERAELTEGWDDSGDVGDRGEGHEEGDGYLKRRAGSEKGERSYSSKRGGKGGEKERTIQMTVKAHTPRATTHERKTSIR